MSMPIYIIMLASLLVGLVKAKSLELKFPWKYVYRVRSTCTHLVVSEPRREGGNFFCFLKFEVSN